LARKSKIKSNKRITKNRIIYSIEGRNQRGGQIEIIGELGIKKTG